MLMHVHAFVGKGSPKKEPSGEGQLQDVVGLDEPCEEVPEKARTFFLQHVCAYAIPLSMLCVMINSAVAGRMCENQSHWIEKNGGFGVCICCLISLTM